MAKKITAPNNTITRDMNALCEPVGNVYETVRIIAKRANQISAEVKQELDKKLADFASSADNLEKVSTNISDEKIIFAKTCFSASALYGNSIFITS